MKKVPLDSSYEELLARPEWQRRSAEIRERDHHACTRCGKAESAGARLHVHHTYYVLDWNPWEYPEVAYLTLCATCHDGKHNRASVPVFRDRHGVEEGRTLVLCEKCEGSGKVSDFSNFKCYECSGNGYLEI